MIKKKKRQVARLAELEERVSGLEVQACENECQIGKLQTQVKCGARGHKLYFSYRTVWFGFSMDTFNFKCSCGVEVKKSKSQLTAKEKAALKTLKIL